MDIEADEKSETKKAKKKKKKTEKKLDTPLTLELGSILDALQVCQEIADSLRQKMCFVMRYSIQELIKKVCK